MITGPSDAIQSIIAAEQPALNALRDYLTSNNILTDDAAARVTLNDCEVHSFPEMWPSTAGPFGGVGGQMFTATQTVVVICDSFDFGCVLVSGRVTKRPPAAIARRIVREQDSRPKAQRVNPPKSSATSAVADNIQASQP